MDSHIPSFSLLLFVHIELDIMVKQKYQNKMPNSKLNIYGELKYWLTGCQYNASNLDFISMYMWFKLSLR